MTKEELKQFIKEKNFKVTDFEVEYTTRLRNDAEFDIRKHWFYKRFKNLNAAKDFFDEVSKKYYNVILKTWKGNSLIILEG